MWRGCYGKEPFDLRLTVLRMFCQLPIIAGVTLLGTLIFGGGYYVKNVWLRGEHMYAATSTYRVEYDVEEEKDVGLVHINQMSWNTYLETEMFLGAVQAHLAQANQAAGENKVIMTDQELAETLEAFLASDLRVPATTVTTESAEKSVIIAKAVEAAMTQEFAGEIREIFSIEVIDPAAAAVEVIPDVRAGRAFGLSAILSCFFAVIVLLLKELGEDSIWLPSILWKRYGLKTLGTIESEELSENIKYFFEPGKSSKEILNQAAPQRKADEGDMREENSLGNSGGNFPGKSKNGRIAVCAVQREVDPEEVAGRLRQVSSLQWYAAPSPLLCPEVCRELREAEGVLLVVRAGRHAGKVLERVLEYLIQQDCRVTAAILWDADERLIRRYYWDRKS